MLSVSIKHPDSERFIDAKMTEGKVTGANVSVRIDDAFVRRPQSQEPPMSETYPTDAENPKYTQETDARRLWGKIVHNAWKSAEPGVLFRDTVIRESVPDCYADLGFRTISTNPLRRNSALPIRQLPPRGRQPLQLRKESVHAAGRVRLRPIPRAHRQGPAHHGRHHRPRNGENRPHHRKNTGRSGNGEVKQTELNLSEQDTRKDAQRTPHRMRHNRRGRACSQPSACATARPKPPDSPRKSHKQLALAYYSASVDMAAERGAFEVYDREREKDNPFINRLREADPELYERVKKRGRRNIAYLTIAPTGTTSLMTQTTSGIEPVFLPVYKRRRKVNPNDANVSIDFTDEVGDAFEEYIVYHHKFLEWMRVNGIEPKKNVGAEELDELVKKSPYYKATSNDVDWMEKVRMQGAVQKWVDHSISVTINLPNNVSEELVGQLYTEAWKQGCKGCTVYRDGSRNNVLEAVKKEEAPKLIANTEHLVKRPQELEADVVRFQNNKEKWIAFVGLAEGNHTRYSPAWPMTKTASSARKASTTAR